MTLKPNLRFLLSLGSTKMVILQDEDDLRVYTNRPAAKIGKKVTVVPEHVAEALIER